jgi:hypothetical protein
MTRQLNNKLSEILDMIDPSRHPEAEMYTLEELTTREAQLQVVVNRLKSAVRNAPPDLLTRSYSELRQIQTRQQRYKRKLEGVEHSELKQKLQQAQETLITLRHQHAILEQVFASAQLLRSYIDRKQRIETISSLVPAETQTESATDLLERYENLQARRATLHQQIVELRTLWADLLVQRQTLLRQVLIYLALQDHLNDPDDDIQFPHLLIQIQQAVAQAQAMGERIQAEFKQTQQAIDATVRGITLNRQRTAYLNDPRVSDGALWVQQMLQYNIVAVSEQTDPHELHFELRRRLQSAKKQKPRA